MAPLAFPVFINLGLNTMIEAPIFTTQFASGGAPFLVLMYAGAAVAFGAVLVRFFRPAAPAPAVDVRRAPLDWAWRIALAVFGSTVALFVVAQYRTGVPSLILPTLGVILPVEVVRSALFLLASVPALFLWISSRRALIPTLGWAHAVTVGRYGLLGAYWFPTALRVAYSLEVTADSFAYAFVIVMLLKTVPSAGRIARAADSLISDGARGR